MPRSLVPEHGKICITDYGYRDWGPELVHYQLDTWQFPPGKLVLLDDAGQAVPFQIDGSVLAFVARVPKGSTACYSLQRSEVDRAAEHGTLTSAIHGDTLEIRNEYLGLRMPAPETHTFATPVAAAAVPPPIKQWTTSGHEWIGAARFATERNIVSYAFSVIRQGPACVEYEARYRFAPEGEYVWRICLSPAMPVALVSEEFDFGQLTEGHDALLLELHSGWQPRHLGFASGAGDQVNPQLSTGDYQEFIAERRSREPRPPSVGGYGEEPRPFIPEADMCRLAYMTPAGKWGDFLGCLQVYDGDRAHPEAGRNIGLLTLSTGGWRRAMGLTLLYTEEVGINVSLPLSVRPMRWNLDCADDLSYFSNHEHDAELRPSYGRRCWGLYAGAQLEVAQARFGFIGLDRYKDWRVDYPENPDGGPLSRRILCARTARQTENRPRPAPGSRLSQYLVPVQREGGRCRPACRAGDRAAEASLSGKRFLHHRFAGLSQVTISGLHLQGGGRAGLPGVARRSCGRNCAGGWRCMRM